MKRLIFILLGLWTIGYAAFSQPFPKSNGPETIVIGDVYDAYTGEPLSNVNIYFQGTPIGTMSNPEGMFLLRGQLDRQRTMVVSAVGYHTERFRIEAGQQVGVEVALREKVGSISDIFVFPGANPALPLMDEVRRHRQANERGIDMTQANAQTALYVSDIQAKHLQRNLWKSLQAGMIQAEDSSYLIPLYWRKQEAEQVQEQAALLTLTDYQILLNQLQSTCNFYDNNVNILSASLLSPLAPSGNTYYNYYLADSTHVHGEKHYIVHFRTKNAFYATFNGEMAIDSATYALRSISASVPAKTSINFLRHLTIQQTFTNDNQLASEDLSLLLDFAIKADTSRIFPTLLITRNTSLPRHLITSSPHSLITSSPDSLITSSSHHLLPPSRIAHAMDSVNNTPLFRTAKFLAYVIQTGYMPFKDKPIEIGKVNELIHINKVEGVRMAVPLRTSKYLWKNVSLGGYIAYSTGDRAWKGMGHIDIALPSKRRHILQLRYGDHYVYSDVDDFHEYIRENSVFNPKANLITEVIRGLPFNHDYYYNTMVRRREAKIHFEDDWNKYLETQAYVKIGRLGYGVPSTNYSAQPSFTYATLGVSARISFNERKIDTYFHRIHLYNNLPVIYVGAELGSYQTPDMPSYRMYGSLQMMLRQRVELGLAGRIDYLLQAGMIFGRVPYPLLHIFAGNPSYTMDAQRFTLMNTYQYAADQYISLQALWDGRGIFFNLIPGVRNLRLRELIELKMAYGGIRNDHQSVVSFPTLPTPTSYAVLSAPTTPYVELGIGIGNIFRVGELYGVFRLTDIHNAHTPWWGIRFRFSLGL